MTRELDPSTAGGLERSCGSLPGDWLRAGAGAEGVERIEAFFGGHAYDPHRHDTYALGLTLTGVQSFDYRGGRQDSLAGNAIVLHPDEVHNGRSGVDSGFLYRMLYLEPRLVRSALGKAARTLPFVKAAVSSDPRLVAAVGRGLASLDAPFDELDRDAVILGIADALLALAPDAARAIGFTPDFAAAERVRQCLHDGHGPISSARLEEIADLDRFALARHFRAAFGTSPHHYLVMRRLDRARTLLRTGAGLADIAATCGFADQSHLTRQFRRAYGLPPGRWRALQQADGMARVARPGGAPLAPGGLS
ncbi:MAG TPA: AraC family transcriptional regulator [Bosea sp. (in: a-proteobacteria)]|jgi:AraC-like DNA-binding protein|uniref:AraC family transcriptional regulator n=1 Tax=Bosea sp. (in: a-proteobacteria) TaxID=1871050 RepID=UPI002E10C200|nr:AraC family transcriptional regulator [Bosea sp. (in: a-proteobacteria)]